jgi:hypothetical protein
VSGKRQADDGDEFENRARRLLGALLPHRQYQEALARFDEFASSAVPARRCLDDLPADDGRFAFDRDDDDDDGDAHVQALMIVGPSGTGKSSLLTAIGRRPEFRDDFEGLDGDVRPIVRLDVPDLPTPKEVVREICAKLHSPAPKGWTRGQVSRRLRELFRDVGLRYLQMDEAHVFVQNLTARQIVVNARFLKFMLISCRVPIILAGEEPLEELLRHKALERRMQAPIRLGPYLWGSMDEVQEWMALAGSLAEGLGFANSSLCGDVDLAMRLYLDTGGIIGLLAKRIVEAGRFVRSASAADLGNAHFSMAWRRWARSRDAVAKDPFAIVEAAPSSLDEDPYSVGPERLKALWTERFHSMTAEDASVRTRRGRRDRNTSAAGFGR